MTDHLVVSDRTQEWTTDAPVEPEHNLRELTQKASWHLASLARVIDQIEETANVARPRGTAPSGSLGAGIEAQLTQREVQVLGLLVQGLSNRRIARTLRISESTVKNHLHAIFLKLDVADRTQAIAAVLGSQHRH
jgi:ATP/maltotriose-dependent transcriptional regulator MalT